MKEMRSEMEHHLKQDLLPFWMGLRDDRGGYFGQALFDGSPVREADKGVILHSRILWFFSNCAMTLDDRLALEHAAHAYRWIRDYCFDRVHGGLYWSVTKDGRPADDAKHTYNLAFGIYALSSYYLASGDGEALKLAYSLFDTIEGRCRLGDGYGESYRVDFTPEDNIKLSGNGVIAERTMNSLLHLYEGYTELYRADHDPRVGKALAGMMDLVLHHVYNPEGRRLEVLFDRDWQSLVNVHSYGHDVEAAWLLDRGAEVLGEPDYQRKIGDMTAILADSVYHRAFRDGSLLPEWENGVDKTERVWWVQAETVVGFYHAWQKTGEERYRAAAQAVWDFIREYMIDRTHGGEWFGYLNGDGSIRGQGDLVGPWKCPYHNGRMCLEIMNRVK
ncbi:MAG: AGE family epimerase/isomerase [Clostridia bacterium]|nr:AGE family epimerase/isomerase [Clostridia bacterium]